MAGLGGRGEVAFQSHLAKDFSEMESLGRKQNKERQVVMWGRRCPSYFRACFSDFVCIRKPQGTLVLL